MELLPGLPDDLGLECLFRIPYDHFSSLSSVCKRWKLEIQMPEFWRKRKAAGFTRNVIVTTQAWIDPNPNKRSRWMNCTEPPFYRLALCEPETGHWSALPPLPGCPNGLPKFCQLVAVGWNLVVMGGWDPVNWEASKSVFIYSFLSAKWRRGTDMPGGRRQFFASASDHQRMVFVAGGHDDEKNAMTSALAYDVVDDRWVQLPDMARPRDECKGIVHRGKFHVIGGYPTNRQGSFKRSAEAFVLATWEWESIEEDFLEVAMCPRTCLDGGDGRLYICRGAEVFILNEDNSTWQVVAELPSCIRITTCVTAWQGKLFVIGYPRFNDPQVVYTLDLKSYTWTKINTPKEFSGHVQTGCCMEL